MKKTISVFIQLPASFLDVIEVDDDQYNLICNGDVEAIGELLDKFDFSNSEAQMDYKVREALSIQICDDEGESLIEENLLNCRTYQSRTWDEIFNPRYSTTAHLYGSLKK